MNTDKFIPVSAPDLSGTETMYVTQAMESTWISSKGDFLTRFETNMAKSVGVEHAIATSNGTTALHLALTTLNIEPGDEVIVPSLTFVATANAVRYCGATPVFVDVNPDSWCMDAHAVKKAITPRTKAVIPVDLFGNVADINDIRSALGQHDIHIVEDVAEAHGASYDGHMAGSLSDLACYSFYGNKIITTGEGGMIVTDSSDLAERARMLRDHGMDSSHPYWHAELGFNYRLTNLQAAIGVAQLERFEEITSKRNQVFYWYREQLAGDGRISLQPVPAGTIQAPWFFTVLLTSAEVSEVREGMLTEGIDTRPLFTPMHKLPMYSSNEKFPVSENISIKGLCLPTFSNITEAQVNRVCEELLKRV